MDPFIAADLCDAYGFSIEAESPVSGGWMNAKARVRSGGRELLVKQYSRERFREDHRIAEIEAALQAQERLRGEGVPCPRVYLQEGRAVRILADGTAYSVMDFSPGRQATPETVTEAQIGSLGAVCGRMRVAFDRMPAAPMKGYPLDVRAFLDRLEANSRERRAELTPDLPERYRRAVLAQERILATLSSEFLGRLPKGPCHEDFAGDNILFDGDGVSAVVDFDRFSHCFTWHDPARALLSLAWREDGFDRRLVRAFCDAYREFAPFDLGDALRVTWCIEAPWWIHPRNLRTDSPKVQRFYRELLFLTERWEELDALG